MRKRKISNSRVMQIINNVAEEFIDLDLTNFASKSELCLVILHLRKENDITFEKFSKMRMELTKIVTESFK